MQIREIENKEEWDNFVMKQPFYTFMNSWDWGEFNKRMPPHQNFWHGGLPPHQNFWCGGKIFRLGFYDGERLAGLALFIKVEARRGTYLFCPYGPVFDGSDYIEQLPNIQCVILSKAKDPPAKRKNEGILSASASETSVVPPQNDAKTSFGDNLYIQKLAEIMPEIIKLARKENVCFIRIQPMINCRNEALPRFYKEFKNLGFKFAPMHVHAEDNWLLDIAKPEDELLKDMRKTTRYLIKRAIKEGVKVAKNNSEEYIDKFIKMHKNHASRDKGGYTAFSEDYIKNLFKVFPEKDINLLYAEYKPSRQNFWCDGQPLPPPKRRTGAPLLNRLSENRHSEAESRRIPLSFSLSQGILRAQSALKMTQNRLFRQALKGEGTARADDNIEAMLVSIKYGKTTAYYLGASDIRHPKFSPAYLLQWESIKKAREAGCEMYNFWGVAPDDNPKHPLAGVSLFKKGFGGYPFNLAHAQDMPLTWKYWLNWAVETMRRKRRGYYYKIF